MNSLKRIAFVCALLAVGVFTIPALETESENFAVDITESQGRFSLYAIDGDERTALYVADDPTTSYFSILLNNRIYRLGDSFDFRQSAETTNDGAKLIFTSSRLEIEIDVDLSADRFVLVDVSISNVSETDLDVGLRMLLDTYLGEDNTHFVTPDGDVITETEFLSTPDYIFSGVDDGAGLYFDFESNRATSPDRIVLANWKRLDDTSWSYTINTNRNFNVVPYSINDSAASLYFNPETLGRNTTRTVRVVLATRLLGSTASTTSSSATSQSSQSGTANSTASQTTTISDATDVSETVSVIDTLVDRIDALLNAATEPTSEEIEQIRAEIDALRDSLTE